MSVGRKVFRSAVSDLARPDKHDAQNGSPSFQELILKTDKYITIVWRFYKSLPAIFAV